MTKQQKILLIVVSIALIGVLVLIFRPQSQPKTRDDSGDPVSGLIDKDDGLLSNLSTNNFIDIQKAIMVFLSTQKINISTKVVISNVENQYRDGSELTFTMEIPDAKIKDLKAKIDFTGDEAMLVIPEKNYSAPLNGE